MQTFQLMLYFHAKTIAVTLPLTSDNKHFFLVFKIYHILPPEFFIEQGYKQ